MPGFLLFILIFVLIGGCAAYVIITTRKALQLNTETWVMKLWKKPGIKEIAASLISILGGMLIGCIILVIMAVVGAVSGQWIYGNVFTAILSFGGLITVPIIYFIKRKISL